MTTSVVRFDATQQDWHQCGNSHCAALVPLSASSCPRCGRASAASNPAWRAHLADTDPEQ